MVRAYWMMYSYQIKTVYSGSINMADQLRTTFLYQYVYKQSNWKVRT